MADSTLRVFNTFYNLNLVVNAEEYEVVRSYFRSKTTSEKTAGAYTENLFRISNQTDIPVLTLLESFQQGDEMTITALMAYFLNSFSDKTVMYGVNNVIAPNNNIARNVVQ
jgi:hypothetical protein